MGKIICEICGTSYPDTSPQCPICGCTQEAAAQMLGEDLSAEGSLNQPKRKKEIFDFDEADSSKLGADEAETSYEESFDEEEDEEAQQEQPNVFAVIMLTVLIVALLAAAGFLFVRYVLPNMGDKESKEPSVVQTVPQETQAQSDAVSIPCETLVLSSGSKAVLKGVGGKFLLHVSAVPSDTTDEIVFTSADESIATVTADGRIEAVAEGETVVTITCGTRTIECQVVVQPDVEEETAPTQTTPAQISTEQTDPAASQPQETTSGDATQPTQEASQDPGNVTLKLKRKDISMGVGYTVQLMLDCGLAQDQVEWRSEHSYIASVDEEGNIRARQRGTTSIIAKYGDQEVSCIVRCG